MPKAGKRRRICAVATLIASLAVIAVVPSALGSGVVPKKGHWSGRTAVVGEHSRPEAFNFTVAGHRGRKVKNLVIRAPRCDGALSLYLPTASAPVKNGKVHLKTTITYTDGFATITFNGTFSANDMAHGTVKFHAKYLDTPCNYTLTMTGAQPKK
jgi:hypothetical protein